MRPWQSFFHLARNLELHYDRREESRMAVVDPERMSLEDFYFSTLSLQRATEPCTVTLAGPTGWKSAGRGRIGCHSCVISTSLPPGLISET